MRTARTAGGWAAFTDAGTAPRWVTAARLVLVLAFAATIPLVLGIEHGNRLVWTVAIAALPLVWITVGYHVWRRICPLAVAGQLGRLLGRPGTRKPGAWLGANYLLVQLALMIVALAARLVATNGSHVWLAGMLGLIVLAAIATSFVYGGKTWCNFLCPVGLVEKVYTEPTPGAIAPALTSQCAPCVACKKHCPDIDLEQGYWKEASDAQRRIAYYSWPGVVIGFYTYYFLVAGDWTYYFSGAWAYERSLPALALDPGFTFAPAIPRLVAAPLTLLGSGLASLLVLTTLERVLVRARLRRASAADTAVPADAQRIAARTRHGMFAFAGLVAFNAFYAFAGQPSLRTLPAWVVSGVGLVIVFASTALFLRRITRREEHHVHEKFAQKILRKWEWGDAPPSDDLKDIYLLHTERTRQREARLRAYKETVREMVADGLITRNELQLLDSLRAQLGISDRDHQKVIGELSTEERQLFDPAYRGSIEQRLARDAYRKDLARLVLDAARLGTAPRPASLLALRSEHGLDATEEAHELALLRAPHGPLAALYERELADLARLGAAAAAEVPEPPEAAATESASLALLRHLARHRAQAHALRALGVLAVITGRADVEQARAQAATRGRVTLPSLAELGGAAHAPPGAELGAPAALAALLAPLQLALRGLVAPRTPGTPASPAMTCAAVRALASDASRHLRAVCAIVLSRFDEDDAHAQLVALLEDPAPIVREAAVRALGANRRLAPALLTRVLADPDHRVRQAAVRAIAGGPAAARPGAAVLYATLDASAAVDALTVIEKMMLIRQVPMFEALDPEDLEELAGIVEERRLEAGDEVVREGEPGDAVYLLVTGTVAVVLDATATRPVRRLSELGPGACFGEMAVLDAAPRSATVRTTSAARLLRVPADAFRRVMAERPELSQAIVAELVKRMRGMLAPGPAEAPPAGRAVVDE